MEEHTLIQRASQGDEQAFTQLVERYQNQVYRQALRMLNHPEDAADVTQEVFLKAWRNLPAFRRDSSLSTWLYRLTDHAAIDLLRRERKRQGDASLDDAAQELAAQIPCPAPTPEQAAERQELRRAVTQGLAQLPLEQRRVLVLRELQGLSYEEMAGLLSLPLGTVKSRVARARLALAKLLGDHR